jgi:hypothetical protein
MLASTVPGMVQAQFVAHTVDEGIGFGYQTLIIDLNADGRQDLIGLGALTPELYWYENPTWERHVLVSDIEQMISVDGADLDDDGIPELALVYHFTTRPANSPGDIAILRHQNDPTEPWSLTDVTSVPSTHRIRWADIDGNGEISLIAAPIVNENAQGQGDPDMLPTPLVYFRPDDWVRRTISEENIGAVHNILPWDPDGDARQEIMSAGRVGIYSHTLNTDGSWDRTQYSAGVPEPYPDGGSSDLAAGLLAGKPFFAAIEPFHGNQVVVYRGAGESWERMVIDTELVNGHTIVIADLSGDGRGVIVAAGTRGPTNLYLYRAVDDAGTRWERTIIDDAVTANNCQVGDINGDGRTDIACIESAAPNSLKWYENTGDW